MPSGVVDLEERFLQNITKQSNGCWEWTGGCRTKKGYGRFAGTKAHRWSWSHHKGPIPEGICVLHKCDNPPCVNPDHLFLGTKGDNNRDMKEKGRYSCKQNGNHGSITKPETFKTPRGWLLLDADTKRIYKEKQYKINSESARKILLSNKSVQELKKEFGVSTQTIYNVLNGTSWHEVYLEVKETQ